VNVFPGVRESGLRDEHVDMVAMVARERQYEYTLRAKKAS
jgi:hypothetical protein